MSEKREGGKSKSERGVAWTCENHMKGGRAIYREESLGAYLSQKAKYIKPGQQAASNCA